MSESQSNQMSEGAVDQTGGVKAQLLNNRVVRSLQGDGLRAKALRGTGWTVVGFGSGQVLRLGSNLVLTRLLFPEVFGLMAIAQVFMQGLNMLSDIGVGPSIVQNKRGDDPDFLATAWTMQIARGFVLFGIMCLLAIPVSRVYDEPMLVPILIWIGLTSAIKGFQSIGLATASRKMALGRLTTIDLIAQVVSVVVMIGWASIDRSVWALVGGGVAAAITRVVLGWVWIGSPGNRIRFERSAAGEIFHFGKWVFVATALTYFGGQGLRLVQGYLVPMEVLGVISIAVLLGMMADQLTKRLGTMVLFPIFADIHLNRPHELGKMLGEARTKLFLLSMPVFVVLILFGRDLIYFMYDERYHAAGVYLVISATGSAIVAQRTAFGMVLIAVGDVSGHAMIKGVTACARVAAVFIGFHYGGVVGMLMADIAAQFVIYPVEVLRLKPKGLWHPWFDLAVFSGYLALGALSFTMGPFFY